MTIYPAAIAVVVLTAMTVTRCAQASAAPPSQPPVTVTMPPRTTYPEPKNFSETRGGTAFALAPHPEPYRLGRPMFVGFWFHTLAPNKTYFRARSDVRLKLIGPNGVELAIFQQAYEQYAMRVLDKGVGAINEDSFHIDLTDFYRISQPGTYRLSATVTLQYPKGVVLNAPPVWIVIER
jgi:hypothetical protein